MGLSSIIQLVFTGVANGCIYALIGMSFILVYNAVGVINFAAGGFVALGAYLVLMFRVDVGMPVVIALTLGSAIMAAVGVLFERAVYRPLQNHGWLLVMISTIGVTMILQDTTRIIWGAQPLTLGKLFDVYSVNLWGVKVNPQYMLIMAVTALLLILQWFLFERTMLGKKLTATSEDRMMARMMGVNTKRMIIFTFVYAMVINGIAGFLLVPLTNATTTMAVNYANKAFVSAVIGGFGSIPGVICGGILVGLIETFAARFLNSGMKDAFAFIVLILFLIIRPRGIFGEKTSKRV